MAEPRPVRRSVALTALALLTSYSSVRTLARTVSTKFPPVSPDEITRAERRFAGLREFLPRRGIVGYVSDQPVSDPIYDAAAWRLQVAQYALTPVVLANNDVMHEFVVIDLVDPRASLLQTLPHLREYELVHDAGDGISLLRSRRRS